MECRSVRYRSPPTIAVLSAILAASFFSTTTAGRQTGGGATYLRRTAHTVLNVDTSRPAATAWDRTDQQAPQSLAGPLVDPSQSAPASTDQTWGLYPDTANAVNRDATSSPPINRDGQEIVQKLRAQSAVLQQELDGAPEEAANSVGRLRGKLGAIDQELALLQMSPGRMAPAADPAEVPAAAAQSQMADPVETAIDQELALLQMSPGRMAPAAEAPASQSQTDDDAAGAAEQQGSEGPGPFQDLAGQQPKTSGIAVPDDFQDVGDQQLQPSGLANLQVGGTPAALQQDVPAEAQAGGNLRFGADSQTPAAVITTTLFPPIVKVPLATAAPVAVAPAAVAPAAVAPAAEAPLVDDVSVRPGAVNNVVDNIQFGLYAKNFYGADMKHHAFTLDSVMTLQWYDPRVIELLPTGVPMLTLDNDEAKRQLWLPECEITNRDIRKFELISSGVTVHSTGMVTKVERSIATIKNKFVLGHYPFDTQHLQVKIASAKYMSSEIKLVPSDDQQSSGVKDDLFAGEVFVLKSFNVTEYEDVDGALQKSRGVMTLIVTRNLAKYWDIFLVPSLLYVVISWGVFWFPFNAPFITPRLALSILAILTFTNLANSSAGALPDGAPYNWHDLFCRNVQILMFLTAGLNVFTEACFHSLKCTETARIINTECKFLSPLMTIVTMVLIHAFAGEKGKLGLTAVSMITQGLLAVTMIAYLSWCAQRLNREKILLEEKEAYVNDNKIEAAREICR